MGGIFRIGFGEKKTLGLKQAAGHSGRQAGQEAQLKKVKNCRLCLLKEGRKPTEAESVLVYYAARV